MNRIIILATIALFATVAFSFDVGIVTRVVDGDTLKVMIDGKEETVRLCGVDTPETVHQSKPVEDGGIEASDFTKQLTGKQIILTYDEKPRDFFGRLLAYVWLESDNGQLICWNVELIRQGHSELYTKYKFDGIDWFKKKINISGGGNK
jgi:endonuclease YncB( thermonuclease family)